MPQQETLQERIAGECRLPDPAADPAWREPVHPGASDDLDRGKPGEDIAVGSSSDQEDRLDLPIRQGQDRVEQVAVVVDTSEP